MGRGRGGDKVSGGGVQIGELIGPGRLQSRCSLLPERLALGGKGRTASTKKDRKDQVAPYGKRIEKHGLVGQSMGGGGAYQGVKGHHSTDAQRTHLAFRSWMTLTAKNKSNVMT